MLSVQTVSLRHFILILNIFTQIKKQNKGKDLCFCALCFTQEKQTRWKSFNSNSQLCKYRSPLSISLEKHAFLLEVKMHVGIVNWLLLLFIRSFSFSDYKKYFLAACSTTRCATNSRLTSVPPRVLGQIIRASVILGRDGLLTLPSPEEELGLIFMPLVLMQIC